MIKEGSRDGGVSWVIPVDPNRCHKYLHKKEEGDLTVTEEEQAVGPRRQRLGRCVHKPRRASSPQSLEEARKGFSPRIFKGSVALLILAQ